MKVIHNSEKNLFVICQCRATIYYAKSDVKDGCIKCPICSSSIVVDGYSITAEDKLPVDPRKRALYEYL